MFDIYAYIIRLFEKKKKKTYFHLISTYNKIINEV